jgi:DNA-binding phage protein
VSKHRTIETHGATSPAAFLALVRQHAARFPVAALARASGLGRATVSRVLTGAPSVSLGSVQALLRGMAALGVHTDLMVVIKKRS